MSLLRAQPDRYLGVRTDLNRLRNGTVPYATLFRAHYNELTALCAAQYLSKPAYICARAYGKQ